MQFKRARAAAAAGAQHSPPPRSRELASPAFSLYAGETIIAGPPRVYIAYLRFTQFLRCRRPCLSPRPRRHGLLRNRARDGTRVYINFAV